MNDRREFLKGIAALAIPAGLPSSADAATTNSAQIAITYDLEMSRHYPKRGNTEWDYQKGNLDQDTKNYSVAAAKIAADNNVRLHFFLVGRVLEQDDISWLHEIHEMGHPSGSHSATNTIPFFAQPLAHQGQDRHRNNSRKHTAY